MCQGNRRETLSLQLLSVYFNEKGLAGSSCYREKEDYDSLDYFRMGIIQEVSLFFFDVEELAHHQEMWVGMIQILKKNARGLRRN